MAKGIFITGTDTDAGKTVVTAGLMYLLRKEGYNSCYFKSALSGAVENGNELIPGDTRFVKTVSGLKEDINVITPYIFKIPVSPHLAARLENNPIDIDVIKEKFINLKNKYDYIVAEGSGGLIVPITEEGYMMYDLIKDLKMDVIVVARAGLGTINHTVLTVKYAQSLGIDVKGIIINGYEKPNICHDDNIKTIQKLTNVPVLAVIPKMENIDVEKSEIGNMKEEFERNVDIETILECMKEI